MRTPRTLTIGDAALYTALYGSRFALQSVATPFAQAVGLPRTPARRSARLPHRVRQDACRDISLNAVANLGYAEGRFLKPVYPGATLTAHSEVIGLKENSNRQTGVVYVRTDGFDEKDEQVLSYVRWVMVRKRDPDAAVADSARSEAGRSVALRRPARAPAASNFDTLFDPVALGQRASAGTITRSARRSTMSTA